MSEYKSAYRKKLRELNEIKDQVSSLEGELYKLYKKSVEFDLELKYQLQLEDLRQKTTGLNIEIIRDYLCVDRDSHSINLNKVEIGIQGDGPWTVMEFQEFLTRKQFSVANITDSGVEYIILGSNNIDEGELSQQIARSIEEGFDLHIYSQELFLAWLITGKNPLEEWSEKDLLKSVEGHESLEYLTGSTEFPWPQLVDHEFVNKTYEVKTFDWDGSLSEESPLRKLGYSVQADMLSMLERRAILKEAYSSKALNKYLNNSHDLDRWGSPNTAQRLYAISSLITWLANFQGSTKPAAREKWISDLRWLKESFYDPKMKFWPMNR